MSPSVSESSSSSIFATLADALQAEATQLRNARHELTLFSGAYLGAFAEYFYYRFEIPEEIYLRGIERASFTFGQFQPVTLDGRIIRLENQFLTVALPLDFGPVLPEINCNWSHEEHLKPSVDVLKEAKDGHPVASVLLQPDAEANKREGELEPSFLSGTPQELQDAVKKILTNRISYVWGPTRSGKTQLSVLTALNYVKAGKRVLLVGSDAVGVDQTVVRASSIAKDLGVELAGVAARIGLPLGIDSESSLAFCLEHEVSQQKAEKRKPIEEQVALLQAYWRTRTDQFLHEDFYSNLTELRDRGNDNRKQLAKVNEEISELKETIARAQHASMLEKLKKSFSKEELATAQKQLAEKQSLQKRLQTIQQALTTELMRSEAQAPIESMQLKEYQIAVRKIGELGGLEKVTAEVEAATTVDEQELLASKRLVIATLATALSNARAGKSRFDLVIVDDAESASTAELAALALRANGSMIVVGDPHQVDPEPYGQGELVQTWLRRNIFLRLAKTDQLRQLVGWSQRNDRWSIFLSSYFAETSKLPLFVASALFDDAIHVFVPHHPKGKIYFIDTSDLHASCRQFGGRKRILPYNDVHTKKVVELVKHALMEPQRRAVDVGVVVPFQGATAYTRQQLRLHAIRNVEVGTPHTFRGHRKKAILFDTTMAGVDYTMRQIDDRKIGEDRITQLLHTVCSCVEEDLYILANMSHFKSVYKDRLWTKLLVLLQGQADQQTLTAQAAKRFDDLELDTRTKILDLPEGHRAPIGGDMRGARKAVPQEVDAELEVRMKRMAKQPSQRLSITGRNFEREIYFSVERVLAQRKDVNLLSQYLGGDILFRHSLATENAGIRLPYAACQNEDEFRKIMERWNLLIYETSGVGKTDLSFFARHTPEARVLWDISSLRAYYSSTVEAVVEEGKHRVAASVSKVFQECLGKSQPANPVEWSTAYLNFLSKMESYLTWISEQLRR
jgi:hypothetical protein